MCCSQLCSYCGWLLLKCSAIGIGFNGAETNCRIAHILGILLMNSCNTDRFLATTVVYGLSTLNANSANLFQELPVFRVKSLFRSIKPISTQPLTIKTNKFNDFISNLICFLFIPYKSFVDSNHFKLKIITTEQEWNCLH